MRRTFPFLVVLAWFGACGGEPPAQEQAQGPTRADSVQMAAAAFEAAVFDTIQWKTGEEALERGGVVFQFSCQKCHGDGGRGNGNFVFRGDTLRPPSFLTKDWRFASDPMGLREYIFHGNTLGMPYWGLVGLKYRDLDAVSRYITDYLRPNYGEK